ncbi:30-kDa cleavage and polyadenylation specificity factor 30-like [Lolium perenne]|uniref:30-kDa cleavage and polyadenylation specificity factor 30-like n=1 Tax=Lolium perenne TaxID=4522 RepID=UPI0021F50BD6|nr:zinc finger CCCH domain-containing protein 45-like [Lolium perenne]
MGLRPTGTAHMATVAGDVSGFPARDVFAGSVLFLFFFPLFRSLHRGDLHICLHRRRLASPQRRPLRPSAPDPTVRLSSFSRTAPSRSADTPPFPASRRTISCSYCRTAGPPSQQHPSRPSKRALPTDASSPFQRGLLMEFDDSDLVFDFEADLQDAGSDSSVVVGAASASGALDPAAAGQHHDQSTVRRTVCKYWLKGLCMRGESCGYLHQYDLDRMPVCHFFRAGGYCDKLDCIFKHDAEDAKECAMYNMGFCPNGPCCRLRHVKKPGPPPPAEEVVKKLQQMNPWNYGSSNATYQARHNNSNQPEKESQNLAANATPVLKQPAAHHAQTENPQHVPPPHTQQQQQHAQVQGVPNGSSDQATITASPLLQGKSRYSVVQSCNQENLEISVLQGVWAFQKGVMMSF